MERTCIVWSLLEIPGLAILIPKLYKYIYIYIYTVFLYTCARKFLFVYLSIVFSKATKVEHLKRNGNRKHCEGIFAIQIFKKVIYLWFI
jgi:hypothetical protein